MGESSFWYRPTRVVPDQRPLNGRCCCCCYSFIYTFFHEQITRDDGFSRLMAQKTLTRARMCLLGVSLTMLLILGVKSAENPNFWGVNRRFQAKRAKILKVSCYRNYCIDFNQILHNDRDHQVVIAGGPNRRPRNPRWRTAPF